mmetsp:Transcript_3405/g.14029  ORF Transcript_3405/g.14029 Transcript_3405/m.14029 type:complete len:649 (+) Transcript_3405:2388-4334(+)
MASLMVPPQDAASASVSPGREADCSPSAAPAARAEASAGPSCASPRTAAMSPGLATPPGPALPWPITLPRSACDAAAAITPAKHSARRSASGSRTTRRCVASSDKLTCRPACVATRTFARTASAKRVPERDRACGIDGSSRLFASAAASPMAESASGLRRALRTSAACATGSTVSAVSDSARIDSGAARAAQIAAVARGPEAGTARLAETVRITKGSSRLLAIEPRKSRARSSMSCSKASSSATVASDVPTTRETSVAGPLSQSSIRDPLTLRIPWPASRAIRSASRPRLGRDVRPGSAGWPWPWPAGCSLRVSMMSVTCVAWLAAGWVPPAAAAAASAAAVAAAAASATSPRGWPAAVAPRPVPSSPASSPPAGPACSASNSASVAASSDGAALPPLPLWPSATSSSSRTAAVARRAWAGLAKHGSGAEAASRARLRRTLGSSPSEAPIDSDVRRPGTCCVGTDTTAPRPRPTTSRYPGCDASTAEGSASSAVSRAGVMSEPSSSACSSRSSARTDGKPSSVARATSAARTDLQYIRRAPRTCPASEDAGAASATAPLGPVASVESTAVATPSAGWAAGAVVPADVPAAASVAASVEPRRDLSVTIKSPLPSGSWWKAMVSPSASTLIKSSGIMPSESSSCRSCRSG